MSTKKSLLLYILLVCVVYGTLEVLSYVGLLFLNAKDVTYSPLASVLTRKQKLNLEKQLEAQPPLRGHHPALGWTTIPHTHTELERINSQGIRADHDFSHTVSPEVIRLSAFGDSFTFGSEGGNEDTWEHQLETRDSRYEVLNFGVGAYGLDQAYLRYLHDGIQFNPDIVIIGFLTENIHRNLNVFRPFYHSTYVNSIYTKPRFTVNDDTLILLENPLTTVDDYTRLQNHDEDVLREIGTHDYFYQLKYRAGPMDILPSVKIFKIASRSVKELLNPVLTREGSYAVFGEGFNLTSRLFDEFYCSALRNHSLPVIVVYPALPDLRRQRENKPKQYAPLLEHFHARGYRHIDLLDGFVAYDPTLPNDQLTVGRWGHYSRLGNTIVATHIQQYLHKENLTAKDRIVTLVQESCPQGDCCPNGSATQP